MKKLIAGAAVLVALGTAHAESTYGYAPAGTGTVTATARLSLQVTVAKMILLRVGSTNTTVDTASWAIGATIPATPANVSPAAAGNSVAVGWTGTAPTFTTTASNNAVNVFAWTNSTTGSVNCTVGAWTGPTGGPANANFTIAVTGSLQHPGANLGACASTTIASNTLQSGTWTYNLGGTPASWPAGVYTNTITYTATGL